MLKLSSCIEMMFGEVPFYDRFAAASAAHCDAVEFWGWDNKDIPRIKELAARWKLPIAAMSVSAKDPAFAAEFNAKRLLVRDGIPAVVKAVEESCAVAKELGIQTMIITTGNEHNDMTRYEQHANIVAALKAAAPVVRDAGIILVLEPLNILHDHRGYFLPSSYEAFEIIDEVNDPNVKVLYDIYHQQISEGNLIPTIRRYAQYIGHFHVADNPGRHEPGTGEINYRNVFKAIDESGYKAYVGLEYSPVKPSDQAYASTKELTK